MKSGPNHQKNVSSAVLNTFTLNMEIVSAKQVSQTSGQLESNDGHRMTKYADHVCISTPTSGQELTASKRPISSAHDRYVACCFLNRIIL